MNLNPVKKIICLLLGLCVLTGCEPAQSKEQTMYHWVENLTTCPKPDPNRYPKQNPNAVALFNKTVEADKTLPQEEIVKLYQQAAKLGHWQAMHNLAISYYEGDGIEEDEEKALYWFKEIEKLGIPEGYADMALVYRKGISVPVDEIKSNDYMIKAAQAGDVDSLFYLGHDLYGQQGQNSKYQAYALKLWQCAAERGHKKAHYFLAIHYEAEGLNKDSSLLSKAYHYYISGAKAGDGGCLRQLSNAYAHAPKAETFNLKQDLPRAGCLYELNEKVRDNPDLTFPNLDELCPGTVPQPNEMK